MSPLTQGLRYRATCDLTRSQQSESLVCYSECFAVVLEYPNVVSHSSKPTLKEGFRPKRLPANRVLERLKPTKSTVCMFVYVDSLLMSCYVADIMRRTIAACHYAIRATRKHEQD